MESLAEGGLDVGIDAGTQAAFVDRFLDRLRSCYGPLRRVLIVPPDFTRRQSGAGELTCELFHRLSPSTHVEVLPATGTHRPMSAEERRELFPAIPDQLFHEHDWRRSVERVGEVPASVLHDLSEGRLDFSVPVELNRTLAGGRWDAIISVGQVVPHEVAGMANYTKNIFVGLGGCAMIHASHYLGAVHGMERLMGRADNPVRRLLSQAAATVHLPIAYLLTVRSRGDAGMVTRGLFAGDDDTCFLRAAELSRQVNVSLLDHPPDKVVVYLDPREYRSTWLGNKAIYRTRMAIADGGELIVLAPGVDRFAEQPEIDALVREFGYRGTDHVVEAVRSNKALASNLAAAAHLIHGSSEGRFTITYAPGGLAREQVEAVGFQFTELSTLLRRFDPAACRDGWNESGGERFFYVSNPGAGLWATADRYA